MIPYIDRIQVRTLRTLHDVSINIEDTTRPGKGPVHLMLTGRNGVGKTTLLDALWVKLQSALGKQVQQRPICKEIPGLLQNIELCCRNQPWHPSREKAGTMVFAYFPAQRSADFIQPKAPKQVKYETTADENIASYFLQELVNLKFQQAFAEHDHADGKAQAIDKWFAQFQALLRKIFNDKKLELKFEPTEYKFNVVSKGVTSPLDHLADGYASMFHILAGIMLRMKNVSGLTTRFETPGIVLIDELETHLHLELQSYALTLLTTIFPNIQFILTTHSPFILSSIGNAVAYELGKKESIDNADEYSYESLVEGFFAVPAQSKYIRELYDRFVKLLNKPSRTQKESSELLDIYDALSAISYEINPDMKAALEYASLHMTKR